MTGHGSLPTARQLWSWLKVMKLRLAAAILPDESARRAGRGSSARRMAESESLVRGLMGSYGRAGGATACSCGGVGCHKAAQGGGRRRRTGGDGPGSRRARATGNGPVYGRGLLASFGEVEVGRRRMMVSVDG